MRCIGIFYLSLFMAMIGLDAGHARVVYLHQQEEKRQVALAGDQGEFIRFLTPEDLHAYHPEFSSDGRYVAYSIGTIRPDMVEVAVHVIDLESGHIEVWTPAGDQYIHAEFSGDGEYLAYSGPVAGENGTISQKIHLIHLPSARARGPVRVEKNDGLVVEHYDPEVEILEEQYNAYFPAVSSDGSFVVYHRTKPQPNGEESKELVRYDREGGEKTLLTGRTGYALVPSLSWDNRYLAYAAQQEDQWDIHILDLWSGDDRRVTRSSVREFTPVFAPDNSLTYTHISGNGAMELDLYRISENQVFGDAAVNPEPFIAQAGVMEYIPSFSGATWFTLRQRSELPEPARSSFGAVAYEGRIYVAGGHQGPEHTYPPESFLDRLDIYDPKTGTWEQGAPMSVPRQGFEMVAHEGFLYAFGGFAYSRENTPHWRSLDIIERYHIGEDRWEVLPETLPRRRSSNIAARVGSKVYLIGGWNSTPTYPGDKEGNFHRVIDVFDLQTQKASPSPFELPDPLRRAFSAVVRDGRIWLLGGISEGASHFNWLDNVTVFDPQADQWREMVPLPFATFAPGAGLYAGRLFLFGGMNEQGGYQNTIYALDLSHPEAWENTGRYLHEKKGFPIVVDHPLGGLGILGGHTYLAAPEGQIDTPVSTFEQLESTQDGR